MDKTTVFTKTAKGIAQVTKGSGSLSREPARVLKLVDGKATFGEIMTKAGLDKPSLEKVMKELIRDGYARIFETRKVAETLAEEDDFDFTAPGKLPGAGQKVVAAAALDISALARQQEALEAERKARENAQNAARDKARQQAEARAKAEAEAKAKAEAEQRAMEQARRAKEASERAKAELEVKLREEEARRKAAAEQQARIAAEQKAKQEEEAKRLAELKARVQAEANARARAELEAKVREEEARKKALAEEIARQQAAAKAKEESEARQLAELRAKAEAEAKSLAEARARAEAEAQALAKARAEADVAAQKQAQEAVASEKELKARLKEEIEARIRSEMETLLRDELEEKTRAEMQAQIMAEARLAAKAELEERLREEREALQKAEMEVRIQAEQAARERADQEAKLRAEAEARAAAESAARLKAEEEARRLREAEARARETAEAAEREKALAEEIAAREMAEAAARLEKEKAEAAARLEREKAEAAARLEAERRAKIEAQARASVEAEEAERKQKELAARIESERRAREQAEARAREEAAARENVEEVTRARVQAELEGDLTRKAEIEGKAQAAAYMEAKKQAEVEEESRFRAEQERKARELAEKLRTKVESGAEEAVAAAPVRRRRKTNWMRTLSLSTVAIVVLVIGLLHVVPLRFLADKLERGIGGWLHDEVSISSLKFRIVPTPHLRIEGIAVGKALDAKATHGRVFVDIPALLGDRVSVNSLELENVAITGEAPRRILSWGRPDGKKGAAEIDQVRLRNVKLDVKPELPVFDATVVFGRDGALKQANLSGEGKWTATLRPREAGDFDFAFDARGWDLPVGLPLPIADISAKGVISGAEMAVPEFEASVHDGRVNGTLKVSWSQGVRLSSDLRVERVVAQPFMATFTKDIAVTGKLEGNFSVACEGATLATLFAAPRAQGKFRLTDGSISNVDLVASMQTAEAGSRAGVTKFAELTGDLAAGEGRVSYRSLNLQGGVLRSSGALDIGANGALSGRLAIELRSNIAQDRGAFGVSGTVARPILRRGG